MNFGSHYEFDYISDSSSDGTHITVAHIYLSPLFVMNNNTRLTSQQLYMRSVFGVFRVMRTENRLNVDSKAIQCSLNSVQSRVFLSAELLKREEYVETVA